MAHVYSVASAGILASRNTAAAQLTVQALFKASKRGLPQQLPAFRKALAVCFERRPRASAYVGALQRLAVEDRGGSVDATEAAAAAKESGSLQAGALQVLTIPPSTAILGQSWFDFRAWPWCF